MPEHRPGLPQRPYPLVIPPAEGFEDAIRRGRRIRRTRTAGAGAGALTLVVGVLGATLMRLPDSAPDRINNPDEPRPAPTVSTYVPPDREIPGASPATPAGSPVAPRAGSVRPGSTRPGPVVVNPNPVAAPGDKKPIRSPRPIDPPRVEKPAMRREHFASATACAPLTDQSGWCDTAVATAPPGDNSAHVLDYRLCPVNDETNEDQEPELRFGNNIEADLKITDAQGNTVWHWSKGQPVTPADFEVTIERGYCLKYTVRWNHVNESGATLGSGTYTLHGWSRAMGFENRAPAQSTPFSF